LVAAVALLSGAVALVVGLTLVVTGAAEVNEDGIVV
jgi:hypothetical protein